MISLVLTRKPNSLFTYGARHGRFGTLIVLDGPKLKSVQIVAATKDPSSVAVPTGFLELIPVGMGIVGAPSGGKPTTPVGFRAPNGAPSGFKMPTAPQHFAAGAVLAPSFRELGRFTTIERMDGYVQLRPQPNEPYGITYETNNSVVIKLAGTGGNCLRVHGGKSAPERGILIHEAPNVAWLIGCIGPRKLGDHRTETDSSHHAVTQLYRMVGNHPAHLFVMDW